MSLTFPDMVPPVADWALSHGIKKAYVLAADYSPCHDAESAFVNAFNKGGCEVVVYYTRPGIAVKRLLTDNGSAFRSRELRTTCVELGIKHSFTRPYRPQTKDKAARFIHSALREWAYGWTYQNSVHRTDALTS